MSGANSHRRVLATGKVTFNSDYSEVKNITMTELQPPAPSQLHVMLELVRSIRASHKRSPGLSTAPFSEEGWSLIEAALSDIAPVNEPSAAESDANGKSLSQDVGRGESAHESGRGDSTVRTAMSREALACTYGPGLNDRSVTRTAHSAAAATALTEAEIEDWRSQIGHNFDDEVSLSAAQMNSLCDLALSALRSGPFAEGYEAAREEAAQFLDDADEHELGYKLRALPTRERK